MENTYQQYKDRGFTLITALGHGKSNGVAATAQDVAAWQSQHGLTHLVGADPNFQGFGAYVSQGGTIYLPATMLLEPGMRLYSKLSGEVGKIPEVLPD